MNKIVWMTSIISIVVTITALTYLTIQWNVFPEIGFLDFVTLENMTLVLKVVIVLVGPLSPIESSEE